ncbi:unnamed protein product, partial [Mesorhabditis belari]|uniref:DNA-directed RNA polymerase n=1 Tax=Mesorhabditis belari TaxID=2138241 RepID=A0AAF3EAX0_9BILA
MRASLFRSIRLLPSIISKTSFRQLPKPYYYSTQKPATHEASALNDQEPTPSKSLDPQYAEQLERLKPMPDFLASLSPAQQQTTERIYEEVKLYAYLGQYVPQQLSSAEWKTLLELEDLSKRIEFLWFLAIKQRREQRDFEKRDPDEIASKIKKRRQELDEVAHKAISGEMVYGPMGFQEIGNPFRRKQRVRHICGARLAAALRIQRPIVGFDMQFLDKWDKMETSSIGKMLNFALTDNVMSPTTFDLRFFNLPKGEKTNKFFQIHLNSYFADKQDQTILPELSQNGAHEALKDAKTIVYLSRYARRYIDGPLSADAYVICASFDNERESVGASRRLGKKVYAASLPIDKYLKWERGSKALPLNNVFRILQEVHASAGDWESALRNNIARHHFSSPEELAASYDYTQSLVRQKHEERLRLIETIAEATGQEFVRKSRRIMCGARFANWALAVGGAISIFFGLLSLTVFSRLVDQIVLKRSYIGYDEAVNGTRPLNEFTQKWIKPPFKMYLQIWMYDVKNSAEILQGSRPRLEEIGPFTFKEEMFKDSYNFTNNETHIFYRNKRTYTYIEDLSCPSCKLTRNVTLPNVIFQKLVDFAEASSIVKFFIEQALKLVPEAPFIKIPVGQALFTGYNDPLIELVQKACRRVPSLCKDLNLPEKIGFFYGQNNSYDGTYQILTGLDLRANTGKVVTWNNLTSLPETWWSTKEARMINGTDGQLFPPLLKAGEDRILFAAQACRSVKLAYKSMTSVEGVPAYRYGVPDSMYDPTLPENAGFCNNATPVFFKNITIQPPGCLPAGLLDISRCQPGQPRVYISQGHFLGSPKEVHEAVEGIKQPNPQLDSTIVDIEPTTGAAVNAMRRAQINIGMKKGNLGILSKTKNLIMPVLWINETARFDAETRDEMLNELWRAKHWIFGVGLTLLFVGAACWLAFIGYHLVITCCMPKPTDDTQALITDANSRSFMRTISSFRLFQKRTLIRLALQSRSISNQKDQTCHKNKEDIEDGIYEENNKVTSTSRQSEWHKIQMSKLHNEYMDAKKKIISDQKRQQMHCALINDAINHDSHAVIQRLLETTGKRKSKPVYVAEGLKILGKQLQGAAKSSDPVDHSLFYSTLNVVDQIRTINPETGAGLLFLLINLEKLVPRLLEGNQDNSISTEMEELQRKLTTKLQFFNLSQPLILYTREERNQILSRLEMLTGRLEKKYRRSYQSQYDPKNPLLTSFRDPIPVTEYQGNPNAATDAEGKNLFDFFSKQMACENNVWTRVQNPLFDTAVHARSAEDYFETCDWKERLSNALTLSLKTTKNNFPQLLIRNLGTDVVANSIYESVLKVLSSGSNLVPQGVLSFAVINPLMELSQKSYAATYGTNDQLWSEIFLEYGKYFVDEEISRKYTHREWWQQSIITLSLPSNIRGYSEQVGSSVWASLSAFVLRILFDTFTLKVNQRNKNKPQVSIPIFTVVDLAIDSRSNVQVGGNNKANIVEMVKVNSLVEKILEKHPFKQFYFISQELPMLVPPRPWVDKGLGGPEYHRSQSIVRLVPDSIFNTDEEMRKRLVNDEQARPVWDALNQLGSTPWTINQSLLKVLTEVFRMGNDPKNASLLSNLSVPQSPQNIQLPTRNEMFGEFGNDDITPEMWKKFKVKKALAVKERNETNSLRCFMLYRLAQAHAYQGKVIYFPHNMDFRGRVYPISPHLSHMGDDVNRCLLKFARGRPLENHGFHWLKRHIINLTGKWKRQNIDERDKAAEAHLALMLDSANNPLNGDKWWMDSDDPWQTLAACTELRDALDSGNPASFVSHLPIHQDGSCNGLQHYAALGRDQQGGQEVNLLPTNEPSDVYSSVAKRVEEKRLEDEANPTSSNHEIAKLLRESLPQEVPRKVVKQTIMTTVYGVTMYGANLQIKRQLKALDINNDSIDKFATYLAEKTFSSLHDAFTSSMNLKDWFQQCAQGISKLHRTTEWVTPLGLPVAQPYLTVKESEGFQFLSPLSKKQTNAFPPNYVHSLDSTHMMLTSLECSRRGITFAAVHDCYWTHACSVDDMSDICRDTFVRLHSEPLVEQLASAFKTEYLPKDIMEKMSVAEKAYFQKIFAAEFTRGELNIDEVRDSIYFFS